MQPESIRRRPTIIPIGGFLGAGKTTLILSAARLLEQRGIKSAAILNDQGSELVDTHWVRSQGIPADQVMGGCFCCLFSDLVEAAERLSAHNAEVIFAEAVGSCTDISATTLQPLKLYHRDQFELAPYTVLVDPARARQLQQPHADPDFLFLFQKQVEEADILCFSKSDLCVEFPEITAAPVRCLSSLSGNGMNAWLDEVLGGTTRAGTKILEIDYEHYARAEASLAWLNCRVSLTLTRAALAPAAMVGPMLENLNHALTQAGFQIAHLKVSDDTASGFLKASVTANGQEPSLQGDLCASPATVHKLLLNIRAGGEAVQLRRVVEAQLGALPGSFQVHSMQCFQPSPPTPEYRLAIASGFSSDKSLR
jgi:hypothetical protein